MSFRFALVALATGLALAGCGGDSSPMFDAGSVDGALPDGFTPDGALPDGFTPDGALPDGFTPDDGAVPDSATPDGAMPDSATPDGGTPDSATPDGGMPDSGDPCTGVDCSGMDDMCNIGVCDPADGTCSAMPRMDGTACDDGNLCTTGDVCASGACMGMAVDCSGMTDMCNTGVCDPTDGSCTTMPVTDGTSCDDSDMCTTGDQCTSGTCGGTAVDCSALTDECHVGRCAPATGACRAARRRDGYACDDADSCTTSDVCTAGVCGGTDVVTGNSCSSAITIPATDGLQTLTGSIGAMCSTSTAAAMGCFGRGAGPEVVYELDLTAPRHVRLETVVPAAGSGYDTVLHIRRDCGDIGTEVTCDDDGGSGLYSLIDQDFEPGTYFIFMDAYLASASGNYELQVDITAPEACASAATLTLPTVGSTTTITGSTTGATNDFTSTCASGAGSPDHVYEFTVTSTSELRFETVAGTDYDTALHIRGAPCVDGAGTTLICDDDGGAGLDSLIHAVFSPGTYYLIVDGFSTGRSGTYVLEVENVAGSTASATYPTMSATLCTSMGSSCTPLGAGGGGRAFQTGDYVEETVDLTGVMTLRSLHLTFDMSDLTTGCAVGDTHTFDVMVNGTRVGGYSFTTGATPAMTRSFDLYFPVPDIAGTGGSGDQYTIQLVATSTVCSGGSSYNWIAGGTAVGAGT